MPEDRRGAAANGGTSRGTVLIVSPHLDDAVLSCWSAIARRADVKVITVFTAGPDSGITTRWDRDTGVDSAARMAQRRSEDVRALALAGCIPVHLGGLERQYGGGRVPLDALESHVRAATIVIAPAGAGTIRRNPEHRVVRDAVRRLRLDCWLYADQPYSDFARVVPMPWSLRASSALRRSRPTFDAHSVSLSVEERTAKAAAIGCYAGELRKLEWMFGPFASPDRLEYEFFWIPIGAGS